MHRFLVCRRLKSSSGFRIFQDLPEWLRDSFRRQERIWRADLPLAYTRAPILSPPGTESPRATRGGTEIAHQKFLNLFSTTTVIFS